MGLVNGIDAGTLMYYFVKVNIVGFAQLIYMNSQRITSESQTMTEELPTTLYVILVRLMRK